MKLIKHPNLNEEKKLWQRGFKYVAGLDEAGRGPLAGPVVAAAVIIKPETRNQKPEIFNGIKDSKKLTALQREKFFKILTNHQRVEWGIGTVSEKTIDKMNILEATKLAMKKSIKNLESRIKNEKAEFLLVDGNMKLEVDYPQRSIIKGDEKVFSCAAASIIAKVTRDKIMEKFHEKYPQYGFDKNKGYPTKLHIKILKKIRGCPIHRKSFFPVSRFSQLS